MILVDQGKVTELCAEPGEFLYDSGTEASIMYGGLGQGIVSTFTRIGKRFTFGGETPKDQRVYYFNTKELIDNRFGTTNPVPFRVVDKNIGLDIDIAIRCNGVYSYRIIDPLLFYTNVCGNVQTAYGRTEIDAQLKSEFLTALQPAFSKISDMGIRYSSLPGHTLELSEALNEVLSAKWNDLRGLRIVSFGVSSVKASEEDEDLIKQLQRSAVMRDPTMAGAVLVGAQSEAMKAAASNTSAGPAMAFMGMNMAGAAGGMNAGNLFQMGQQQQAAAPQQPFPAAAPQAASPTAGGWQCACGAVNQGKFCQGCGQPQPAPASAGWQCACGAVNQGKFCQGCGQQQPAAGWTCSCGAVNQGKFCQGCGNPQA